MNQIWFKKWSWIYIPVHAMGLIITLLAIIFLVPVFCYRSEWAFCFG